MHIGYAFKKCVSLLKDEWNQHKNNKLPPVLCHMDLQPQNLAFQHEDIQQMRVLSTIQMNALKLKKMMVQCTTATKASQWYLLGEQMLISLFQLWVVCLISY